MFEFKIKNNTTKPISFLKFESNQNYSYIINNTVISSKNYFIIKIQPINNMPMIINLIFSVGTLEIRNYLQTYEGQSLFIFKGIDKLDIVNKIKYKPSPLLPQISLVDSIVY
ncbi:hypothetical protein crov504 [Cafeteria roenbergensis virus]|uniref:Uncharacterized protein n=1 Tax=Cafeteria roenbergensis virus (strain BV-PW1) TaxID=693272 RepID=E3T5S5_CROVB|nr:hypothetical protein crov504 [Cafeteria roenbergensis virus BV-PW1]ADO67538.1 hypothetical protein crov504 [Cafeteria roenbergensis virus BV-PW1]